jgi:GntR family transcriptional repressor for pyruvate dehydrogenase complex
MARLHQGVMRAFITDIVTGVYAPGDKLPKEVDLAEVFRVSRGVSRETIRALEERGLISVTHGRGATVNDDRQWNLFDPDVLSVMLEKGRSADVLSEYLECRQILELEAAALAARRARKKDIKPMAEAFARMEEAAAEPQSAASEARFLEADVSFHQALIAATGNRSLGALVSRIHAALFLARFPLARPDYRQARGLPDHARILAAVRAGDPDAAREAMRAHLDSVAGYLREHERTLAGQNGRRRR